MNKFLIHLIAQIIVVGVQYGLIYKLMFLHAFGMNQIDAGMLTLLIVLTGNHLVTTSKIDNS